MKRAKRMATGFFTLMIAAIFVISLAENVYAQQKGKSRILRFGTSSLGSSGYRLSAVVANLINKYTNYDASVIPSGGTSATIRMVNRKQREVGFGGGYDLYMAYHGIGEFSKDGKQPIAIIARAYNACMTIIAQANIKSVQDFKGKVFMYKRKPNRLWGLYGDAVLAAYGLSDKEVRCEYSVESKEIVDGLKTGAVSIGLFAGTTPMTFIQQLLQSKDYNIIGVGKEMLMKMAKKYPFMVPITIPAGTYRGQDKDVYTMGYSSNFFVRSDLDKKIVYDITKLLYTHHDELVRGFRGAKDFTPQNGCENPVIPLHPGAVMYYKEVGALGK